MTDIPALILAGGRSSRMGGGDKGLMPLNGRPLLSHVLERIRPQASRLLINSNSDPSLFGDFGLPVQPDILPDRPGPLAGILTGLRWAAEHNASHLVTVPCDTPFLPHDLVQRLKHDLCRSGAQIAIARDPEHSSRDRSVASTACCAARRRSGSRHTFGLPLAEAIRHMRKRIRRFPFFQSQHASRYPGRRSPGSPGRLIIFEGIFTCVLPVLRRCCLA